MMNGMGSFGFGGMGFTWIFWLLFLGIIVWAVITFTNRNKYHYSSSPETPMDMLKKRYVRGEITKDQFNNMKKDMTSR